MAKIEPKRLPPAAEIEQETIHNSIEELVAELRIEGFEEENIKEAMKVFLENNFEAKMIGCIVVEDNRKIYCKDCLVTPHCEECQSCLDAGVTKPFNKPEVKQ